MRFAGPVYNICENFVCSIISEISYYKEQLLLRICLICSPKPEIQIVTNNHRINGFVSIIFTCLCNYIIRAPNDTSD